jgi:hypothetical protein
MMKKDDSHDPDSGLLTKLPVNLDLIKVEF